MNQFSLQDQSINMQGLAQANEPSRRRVGRFRESVGIRLLRQLFRATSVLAPTLCAQVGYRMLAKPPRAQERAWQRELRLRAKLERIHAGGQELMVYSWGAGPVILMVHGWGARATQMGRMIDPLVNAGYRVVAFDAPAHGDSSGSGTDLIQFASAIHAVAAHVGQIDTLMAHSFGVAMALFARRDWGIAVRKQVYISGIEHCKWITDTFARYSGINHKVIAQMQQMMVERHNAWFSWDQLSVKEMLRKHPEPCLLIHDKEDEEVPFQHSVSLYRAAPSADLYLTQGLGHHRLLGKNEVIDRVVNFVRADAQEVYML